MRAKWEGTYTQQSNGRWRVQLSINGVRHSHTAPTKRAAQRWVAEMRAQADQGLTPDRVRLDDALQRYLQHLHISAAHSTYLRVLNVVNTYRPLIGQIYINRLTPARLNQLFAQRLEHGYAASTVVAERRILHSAVQRLVREGVIARNPVSHSTSPRVEPRDYTAIDARAHAAVNSMRGNELWYAYALLLNTGMRVGELLGVTWADITFAQGGGATIRIERTDRGPLKTSHSRRTVTIGAPLARQIEPLRGYDNQLVVPCGRAVIWRVWQSATPSGLRLHDLRHAHASELLAAGVPITAVSRRLGHASATITLGIYAHLVDAVDERVADVVRRISEQLA